MRKNIIKVKFLDWQWKKTMEKKLAFRQRQTRIMMAMAKVMAPRPAVKGRKVFFRLVCKGHVGFDPQGRVSRYRIITLLKMIQKVKDDVQKMCQSWWISCKKHANRIKQAHICETLYDIIVNSWHGMWLQSDLQPKIFQQGCMILCKFM